MISLEEDELWDYYSDLPNPMWYHHIEKIKEERKRNTMNNLDKTYTALLQDILDNGVEKKDRTGTGTISVFGRQIRHKMSDGFPLLTTKKMHWKSIVTELLWFLRGDTNIKYLVDNNCHIWNGDAYKNYQWNQPKSFPKEPDSGLSQEEFINKIKTNDEFAKKWGDLGPVYGQMWRDWDTDTGEKIDQIANLINDLKTNPDGRRLMVSAWNPTYIPHCVLPPCHYGFQVYTRELSLDERNKWSWDNWGITCEMESVLDEQEVPKRAISLMWNQRSVDTFLGLPFNIASYGLLLMMIADEVNMVPDELIGNLGDVHLYLNHIEQAKEQIGRELSLDERAKLVNDNDVNISLKLGDGVLAEARLDKLNIPRHTREPYPLPKLNIKLHFKNNPSFTPEHWLVDDFVIEDYKSHPAIKAPLSN
jgi:thymidylate synthase